MLQSIHVGQLVRVPFRQSEEFGLVLTLAESDREKLKYVSQIVQQPPLVSREHLTFLQTLSALYGVSLPTIARMSLLPLQKSKLQKMTLTYEATSQTKAA